MENFVKGFRQRHPFIPEELYGRLARPVQNAESSPAPTSNLESRAAMGSGPRPGSLAGNQNLPNQSRPMAPAVPTRPKILIALSRSTGNEWSTTITPRGCASGTRQVQDVDPVPKEGPKTVGLAKHGQVTHGVGSVVATSVDYNVSSCLSGVRATFRNQNQYVNSQSKAASVARQVHDKK